jgi:transposase-like protein
MLRSSKRTTIKSVRLFPRLATAKKTPRIVRLDQLVSRVRDRSAPANKRDDEATHVRARLLRMILENESRRRGDWRPSAS